MKRSLLLLLTLSLAISGFAQTVTITGVVLPGVSSPQQWCTSSSSGGGLVLGCSATLDTSYELHLGFAVKANSTGGQVDASTNIQGSMAWNVEWTGSTAPLPGAQVVLQFTTSLQLYGTAYGTSATSDSSEGGDELVGTQQVLNNGSYNSGPQEGNQIYTSVPSWTKVSSGVWTGTTGWYTANLSGGAYAYVTPNDGSASASTLYKHTVALYSVGGVVASN